MEREQQKQHLIHKIERDCISLDDGFKYFWPDGTRGALSADNLRTIADYLDTVNKPWADKLDEYFRNSPDSLSVDEDTAEL